MKVSRYSSKKVIALGVIHIVLGALSIALGIASATPANGNFPYGQIGYGIWGGILYVLNGFVAIAAGACRSPDLIISHLVLSIIVSVIAAVQFSLGVASAVQDNFIYNYRSINGISYLTTTTTTTQPPYNHGLQGPSPSTADPETLRYYAALNKFYENENARLMINLLTDSPNGYPSYYNRRSNKLNEFTSAGTVAVDALLAISGFLMAFIAILSSSSGCKVTCCDSIDVDTGMNGNGGMFPSNGGMMDGNGGMFPSNGGMMAANQQYGVVPMVTMGNVQDQYPPRTPPRQF